jgi:hypothetical protein
MERGSFSRGRAGRNGLTAGFVVGLAFALTLAISPVSAGSKSPSAVGPFYSVAVSKSRSGHQTVRHINVLGISPGESVIVGCFDCGHPRPGFFTKGGADAASLTASPPIRVHRGTRLIIGAIAPGLIGRWKVYGLHPTFALLDQGCMPPSVTTLTAAEARDPSTIPRAACPAVCLSPQGAEFVLWRGTGGQLSEVEYAYGVWDHPTSIPSGQLDSAPTVAVHPDGQQDVFWQGRGGRLLEMWYTGKWNGPVTLSGPGTVDSAPAADVDPSGVDRVFWKGAGGYLWELSDPGGHWGRSVPFPSGQLGSAPSATTDQGGVQHVFWKGTDGRLWEIKGASRVARPLFAAGSLGSRPTVAVDSKGVDHVFWAGTDGTLWELANPGGQWFAHSEPFFSSGTLGSPPAVAIRSNGEEDVFWRGAANRGLYEYWYTGGIWHGAHHQRTAGKLGSQPAAAVACG